jgi:hypothetical protein
VSLVDRQVLESLGEDIEGKKLEETIEKKAVAPMSSPSITAGKSSTGSATWSAVSRLAASSMPT